MPDKAFIDTNILVYFITDEERGPKAREAILSSSDSVVSSQVINEPGLRQALKSAVLCERLKLI